MGKETGILKNGGIMNTIINILNDLLKNKYEVNEAIEILESGNYSDLIEDADLLKKLIHYIDTNVYREKFWETIIFYVSPNLIDDYSFDYFYKNNIALEKLSHMKLCDEQLIILSEKYEEASFSLGRRYYSDKYDINVFINYIDKCQNENVLKYLLTIPKIDKTKRKLLIELIEKKTGLSDELKSLSLIQKYLDILKETEDLELIIEKFEKKIPDYYLSIAENINTPDNILLYLSEVSGVKNASLIRNKSKKTLFSKKRIIK